ncbi:MAG TPA: hypothetical protein HA349_00815 [Methanotrichaceae archaeon]|nr:hypothetical protein [Methanotrichaceae archaeon]
MKKQAYGITLLATPVFFMAVALLLVIFPVAVHAGSADDVNLELLSQQSESIPDSDFELISEEFGDDTDEDTEEGLTRQRNCSHRPQEGSAARVFYDRLVYIMGNLRVTEYVHSSGRVMDEDDGRYKYDCSGFVGDFILNQSLPDHYKDLDANDLNDENRTLARGFYDYFSAILGDEANNKNDYWYVFRSYDEIQPGDIIVARYNEEWRDDMINKWCGIASTGHVMVAWSFPVNSTTNKNEFWIYVIDSSNRGHCKDSRKAKYDNVDEINKSGIGKGEMWFGYEPSTHQPIYYRWSSSTGCDYTLHNSKTICTAERCCDGKKCSDDNRKDKACVSKEKCITEGVYYERLEGIIMARPIWPGQVIVENQLNETN